MPDQPPLLDAIWAAYIGVVATILIGIFFTKDDKRNFENIVSNIVSFALLLATVQFTWLTLLVMGLYLVAGIIIAIEQVKKWFFLVGSKTYGPLALMILLSADGRAFFGFTILDLEFPITMAVLENIGIIIVGWIILSVLAHGTCYFYYKKPAPKKRKSSTISELRALFGGAIKRDKKDGRGSSRRGNGRGGGRGGARGGQGRRTSRKR